MINKIFKEKFDPTISATIPENNITLTDDKRADVLISVMNSIRQNILSWTERSYKVTSWSVGILLSVLSFWILYGDPNSLKTRFIIALGLFIFGSFTQLYLLSALRAFRGNGDALIKCEAALKLCNAGFYSKDKPFFGYSGQWLSSKSLTVLRLFHVSVLIVTFLSVLFISPAGKTIAENSIPIKIEKQKESVSVSVQKVVQDDLVIKDNLSSWISLVDIGSSVTTAATVILAFLTAIYVILTRKILQSQVEPCVVITVVHDEKRFSILQLVVENIGNGIAHDIKFEFSRSIPMKSMGLNFK